MTSCPTGESSLLDAHPMLQRTVDVRTAYLDQIDHLLVSVLARLRGSDSTDPRCCAPPAHRDGIATGPRNTG